jgi:hypothetical protein
MSALDPALMTTEERLGEVARILLVGIVRSQQKKVKLSEKKESFVLDVSVDQSVHGFKPIQPGERS